MLKKGDFFVDINTKEGLHTNLKILYGFALMIHIVLLIIFFIFHIKLMTMINVISVGVYIILTTLATLSNSVKIRNLSIVCSVAEVVVHQVLAVICVGAGCGFQLFLIMTGIIILLQPDDTIRRKYKISICCILTFILITTELIASFHVSIYVFPLYVKRIFMACSNIFAVSGMFGFAWNQWNINEHYREQIEVLLKERNTKIVGMQDKIINNFADIMEQRDGTTGGHIKRTSAYVAAIVNSLKESGKYLDVITPEYEKMIISVAPLHDIGKIAISDSILRKHGRLTDEEYEKMKRHASIGGDMLEGLLGDIESEEYIKLAKEVARHHHERWNGSGYPDRLMGDEIPLSARIMAVADVFDALTSERTYKDKFSIDKAYQIMESEAGQQFDATIIKEFRKIRPEVEEIYYRLCEE